ncbi:MAG TPA: NUDIX hydrolase, partial [Ornithinimicrobium sp.]|nr:NUDIX hydrolase [Ornithinimicrobium sp.]
VHRPRYDDWSWPKGKLDPGEDFAAAAARETLEETGLRVRLGRPLPDSRYALSGGQDKVVRYWAGEVVGGDGELEHEVDEVRWMSPTLAARRLTYGRDHDQLDALVALEARGRLGSWPLLVVRHAHAHPRNGWSGPDPARPLSAVGVRRAARLVGILGAYAPVRVLSSPSVRCFDTVEPFCTARGVELVAKKGLSEEGFEERPEKVHKHLGRILAAAEPVAVCTHGPVMGPVLADLLGRAGADLPGTDRRVLARLVDVGLDKGEVLAFTMVGSGEDAQVAAVLRHRPPG